MSEIEKMYENANVEDKNLYNQLYKDLNYPQFNAEKQMKIVCFLINRGVELSFNCEQGEINMQAIKRGLAGLINVLWQDLTEEEKQQIKEILK